MGAWGLGPFENDGALEPLSDLEHGDVGYREYEAIIPWSWIGRAGGGFSRHPLPAKPRR